MLDLSGNGAAQARDYFGEEEDAMDYDLSPQQRHWRGLARDFAQGTIRPQAETLDREQRFPYAIIHAMADLGLLGLSLPEEYGGSGGDFISLCLAIEEISRADTSV